MTYQKQISAGVLPASWVGRLIAALIAASLALVGLFFIAFALVAAGVLAAVVAVRIWWVIRRLRAQRDSNVIEGSYSVAPGHALPVRSSYVPGDIRR